MDTNAPSCIHEMFPLSSRAMSAVFPSVSLLPHLAITHHFFRGMAYDFDYLHRGPPFTLRLHGPCCAT